MKNNNVSALPFIFDQNLIYQDPYYVHSLNMNYFESSITNFATSLFAPDSMLKQVEDELIKDVEIAQSRLAKEEININALLEQDKSTSLDTIAQRLQDVLYNDTIDAAPNKVASIMRQTKTLKGIMNSESRGAKTLGTRIMHVVMASLLSNPETADITKLTEDTLEKYVEQSMQYFSTKSTFPVDLRNTVQDYLTKVFQNMLSAKSTETLDVNQVREKILKSAYHGLNKSIKESFNTNEINRAYNFQIEKIFQNDINNITNICRKELEGYIKLDKSEKKDFRNIIHSKNTTAQKLGLLTEKITQLAQVEIYVMDNKDASSTEIKKAVQNTGRDNDYLVTDVSVEIGNELQKMIGISVKSSLNYLYKSYSNVLSSGLKTSITSTINNLPLTQQREVQYLLSNYMMFYYQNEESQFASSMLSEWFRSLNQNLASIAAIRLLIGTAFFPNNNAETIDKKIKNQGVPVLLQISDRVYRSSVILNSILKSIQAGKSFRDNNSANLFSKLKSTINFSASDIEKLNQSKKDVMRTLSIDNTGSSGFQTIYEATAEEMKKFNIDNNQMIELFDASSTIVTGNIDVLLQNYK
jgi:hypothetical protein